MSVAAKGPGPQNPTKKLAHVGVLLSHLLSQNRVPKLSDPGPPLNYVYRVKLNVNKTFYYISLWQTFMVYNDFFLGSLNNVLILCDITRYTWISMKRSIDVFYNRPHITSTLMNRLTIKV